MKVELPEFKRCCCFLPLRYGLLTWAYIKLIVTVLIEILIMYVVIDTVMFLLIFGVSFIGHAVVAAICALLPIMDICFTIVFIIGGHKKNVKLLRLYYIYSIGFTCVFTVFFVIFTGFELYLSRHYHEHKRGLPNGTISFILLIQSAVLTLLVNIGIQVYFVLLIRSEISKLKNNCQFRFVNTANEVQCAMENGVGIHENGAIDHENIRNGDENAINVHDDGTHAHDFGTAGDKSGTYDDKNGVYDFKKETKDHDNVTDVYTIKA